MYLQKLGSNLFYKRLIKLRNSCPYISFTFDDFPRSALHVGGNILNRFGLCGTYYTSLGLMDKEEPPGRMFAASDLRNAIALGHELGCHTYAHHNSLLTRTKVFEESIVQNKQALRRLLTGVSFKSLSYPIEGPRVSTKRMVERYFDCCRGGGQAFNTGRVDLNLLKAFFLEKVKNDEKIVKDLIDKNRDARGWLIFATHDIDDSPSPYGCTTPFFQCIVEYSIKSGAKILPVSEALRAILAEQLKY
jgi:peptidoglycan/xylan/chitin deacetylase (PgdA/CDA1 family)